jgi:myo-inositol catabolism protein IolS
MQYSSFSVNQKKISKLSFGGASLSGEGKGYGFGAMDDKSAEHLIALALDVGITVFDSAPIYGHHLSEIRLGKYLNSKRDEIILVSKAGVTWHDNGRVNMSNDPLIIENMLHTSLKHLKSDYIDIYMIHWPDPRVDIRYSVEVLQKAKEQGKILQIGLCNTTQDELLLASEVSDIEVVQAECNFFHNAFNKFSFPKMKMGWGTLDKGILSGTVTLDRKFEKDDCRSWAPWWKQSQWQEKVKKVEALQNYLKETQFNLLSVALAFSEQHVDTSLCGFKNEEQLTSLLKAMENLPSKELLAKIEQRFFHAKN